MPLSNIGSTNLLSNQLDESTLKFILHHDTFSWFSTPSAYNHAILNSRKLQNAFSASSVSSLKTLDDPSLFPRRSQSCSESRRKSLGCMLTNIPPFNNASGTSASSDILAWFASQPVPKPTAVARRSSHSIRDPYEGTDIARTSTHIDAAVLSVELTGLEAITPRGNHSASIHIRYHWDPTDRPIILRSHVLWLKYRPYRLEDGYWQLWESECPELFLDGLDITVRVAQDGDIVALRPGECWSDSWGTLEEIDHWEVGDTWWYWFKSGTVDYGGAEEHVDTTVKVPPHPWGRVTGPADNGGQPQLVISASNAIESRIVEERNMLGSYFGSVSGLPDILESPIGPGSQIFDH
ncbi:hypothetical protein ETB97_010338 [Aspergillus alliaceus]|uniref:Uncharacterized protein n=1 Tax=Petromyces alliaceus TaxID=209559 RepID=A0A8H5ZTQ5_PETAA|nr:hypothetical protein ETB97_010338 [Aspergillus burnettii]